MGLKVRRTGQSDCQSQLVPEDTRSRPCPVHSLNGEGLARRGPNPMAMRLPGKLQFTSFPASFYNLPDGFMFIQTGFCKPTSLIENKGFLLQ